MKRSALTAFFYVTLVFVSGVLVGTFATRLYYVKSVIARQQLPRPTADEVRRAQIEEFRTRFNLSPDQAVSIDRVFEETRVQFKAIHQKIDPEMKQLRKGQVERVRALLSPEQQVLYDAWRAEHDQDNKR